MNNPYARKLDPAPPHTVKVFNRMVAARVKAHDLAAAEMQAKRNADIIASLIDADPNFTQRLHAESMAIMLEATA